MKKFLFVAVIAAALVSCTDTSADQKTADSLQAIKTADSIKALPADTTTIKIAPTDTTSVAGDTSKMK